MKKTELAEIFKHCAKNKEELIASAQCGCINCRNIFEPKEIVTWVGFYQDTAICPLCGCNVIIAGKVTPLTPELLQELHEKFLKENHN